jgi:hypothetical protein
MRQYIGFLAASMLAIGLGGCGGPIDPPIEEQQDHLTAQETPGPIPMAKTNEQVSPQIASEPNASDQAKSEPLAVGSEEGAIDNASCVKNWELQYCTPFKFLCWHTGSYQSCCESYSSGCGQVCLSECMSVCGLSRSTCENSSHCGVLTYPSGQCDYPN